MLLCVVSILRNILELHHDLRCLNREPFSGTNVERNPRPAEIIDIQFGGKVRFRIGARVYIIFCTVTFQRLVLYRSLGILPAHHVLPYIIGRIVNPQRTQHLDLLVAEILRMQAAWRLHRHHRNHLKHMVLPHIPERAGMVIVSAPFLHAYGFTKRDLHVSDVFVVPDRLEESIGKPDYADVLHHFFAQIVIDPVNFRLVEHLANLRIQLFGRLQVVPERLLDDQPVPAFRFKHSAVAKVVGHASEQLGSEGR